METILQTPIVEEVEQSFLDYSMSVITDRAIPSAEDGLKPVHRRILWAMLEGGMTSDKAFHKCAEPVGNTIAYYHPHGDTSTYGALIKLSQPWAMRYPLISFHGNNGSRDGDPEAAYRYTECKLSKYAEATLTDIKKDTVNMVPNFTNTKEEPEYLPGIFPHLLCNGTSGIAVAMACVFLPHNLSEVIDAINYVLLNPECEAKDILQFIQGPDFPTGGTIINKNELENAYLTGKGRVRVRGDYVVEKKKNKEMLVFTSIPYQVSKEALIKSIIQLCEEKKIDGISKVYDDSNRHGVRFVVELNKDANPDIIATKLYRLTNLENSFSFNQVALVNKTPKLLNFKQLIDIYIEHQEDVQRRKCTFEYNKISAKIHTIEGLLIALEDIDNVITLIKKSADSAAARSGLMSKYHLSENQAKAILEMQLRRLAHLEKIELENNRKELVSKAEYLNQILTDVQFARVELTKDISNIKKEFGDARLTKVTHIEVKPEEKEIELVEPEDCVVVITESNNIKRIPNKSFKTQKKNGKGVKTQDDITTHVINTNTVDTLMVFSSSGKMYRLLVDNIPEGTNVSRGVSIATLVNLETNEKPIAYASLYRTTEAKFVLFVTKNGLIKKTPLEEYIKTKKSTGLIALTIKEGDALSKVTFVTEEELLLVTKKGMCIRFDSKDSPISSRVTQGVKGIALNDDDEVITILPIKHTTDSLALISASGLGKKIPLNEFAPQKRGGKGVICYKTSDTTGGLVGAVLVDDKDTLLITGNKSSICISAEELPVIGKTSIGNSMIKNNTVVSVSKV